jgi:hypothetical protein
MKSCSSVLKPSSLAPPWDLTFERDLPRAEVDFCNFLRELG